MMCLTLPQNDDAEKAEVLENFTGTWLSLRRMIYHAMKSGMASKSQNQAGFSNVTLLNSIIRRLV
jgi:hypothetical protein